ncbi:MAG: glycosyltransferase family 1 protein [Lachnospiraceae bacterium]|nr:glycosyltransferase family 1 protein [Lachnospiraceae bacterium]
MMKESASGKHKHAPIRVLHIAGSLAPGGIETFLMNLHEQIDKERFAFDYAVNQLSEGDYANRARALGGNIFVLPRLSSHPVSNLRSTGRLVRDNRYDVVIRHTANAMVTPQLLVAKKNGAKTILHAHNESDPMKAAHVAGRLLMGRAADARIACSEGAGRWMYGRQPFVVMKNAIDIRKFAYSAEGEARIRKEFRLGEAHLYGSIANFRPEKNHAYLLEVFRLIKDSDPDAKLLCLGDGALRASIESAIREKHLEDSVILAGTRADVADVMSAMDVLLFPSLFEGLPVTLIEAQAAGLSVLLSENVTKDVVVTDGLVSYLPIDVMALVWAKEARVLMSDALARPKQEKRIQQTETIAGHGYDMKTVSKQYMELAEALVTR